MYSFPLHCNRSRLPTPGPIVNSNLGALCPLIPLLPFLLPHHPEEAYPLAILVLLACYQHLPHPSPTPLKLVPENTCPAREHLPHPSPTPQPPTNHPPKMDLGGIDTPPSPNCDTVHEVESCSPAQPSPPHFKVLFRFRPYHPPDPQILASLAKATPPRLPAGFRNRYYKS